MFVICLIISYKYTNNLLYHNFFMIFLSGTHVISIFAMSNYNGNIEKRKAAQDLMKNRRENTSKYFFDLSKLTFAALVLGVGSALLK